MNKHIDRLIKKATPLKFFIITAAVFGLGFLVITPPFQGADEIVHFYRAYQVSEGNIVADKSQGGAGGHLPKSLGEVVAITNTPIIKSYPQLKYDIYNTKEAFGVRLNESNRKFYDFSASATYSPAAYIGSAPAILVARLLHLPALAIMYAARAGDLIAWIVIMALSIHLIPRRKWALVAIGLLPMALFQASTLNGDALTIGSLALLLALILNFRERVNLGKNELTILLLAAIVMVLTKQVMFIFLPLVLMIKDTSFKLRRQAILFKIIFILIPLIFFLGWFKLTSGIDSGAAYANNQNPNQQLMFIAHSPHSFINVLWNTYFYNWSDGIVRSFIGIFGWADAPLSEFITTIGYIGLAFLFIVTPTATLTPWLTKKEKRVLITICLLYWAAVSASLYLYFSPVGYKIVYGLQGRYFIPLAIVAIPLLQTKLVKAERHLYKKVAILLPIFLLIVSTITTYARYFVHNV